MKSFTLSDFGGGLNTSVDESLLPPNMSADIRNADILDSRAIRRRNGYRDHTDVLGSKVLALHRFYRTDGEKYWVAMVSGVQATADAIVQGVGASLWDTVAFPPTFVNVLQSFTPSEDIELASVTLDFLTSGSALAYWQIDTDPAFEEQHHIASSDPSYTTLTDHDGDVDMPLHTTFNDWDGILTGGTTYHMIASVYGGTARGIRYSSANPYAGGGMSTYNSLTFAYEEKTGSDLRFTVRGVADVTGVKVAQDVGTEVPTTTLEAEDATYTGTATEQSWGGFSGGVALGVTSASFSIPKHSALTVHGKFGIGASLNIGSGYVTATGNTYTFSGLSATSRTLGVKGGSRGSTRLKMEATSAASSSYCTRTRNITSGVSTVSVKFYDVGIASLSTLRSTEVVCGGLYVGKTDGSSHYLFDTKSLFLKL